MTKIIFSISDSGETLKGIYPSVLTVEQFVGIFISNMDKRKGGFPRKLAYFLKGRDELLVVNKPSTIPPPPANGSAFLTISVWDHRFRKFKCVD